MPERQEKVSYEQDRLGNERRKLDTLRAQEGNEGLGTGDGIAEVATADVGTDVVLYEPPDHADRVIAVQLQAYNAVAADGNTFQLLEADLDDDGAITGTVERSVPIVVANETTRVEEYKGVPFEGAIAVNSDFEGQIGVAVIADHDQASEPAAEQTT